MHAYVAAYLDHWRTMGYREMGVLVRAKALLTEAGYPAGFETSLTVASSFPSMLAMAPIIQANLAAVGIKLPYADGREASAP